MNVFETERLIFREMTIEDAEDLYRIYSNPLTMEFMGKGFDTVKEGRERIQKHIEIYYQRYGFGLWATILKENNHFIGRCGLRYEELEGVKELELVGLIDCDYWARGLVTEASRAIVEIGFEKYNFNRIIALILPDNKGSIRVAEKVGMTYEREIASYLDFGRILLYGLNKQTVPPSA